jgi:hypothetical protein
MYYTIRANILTFLKQYSPRFFIGTYPYMQEVAVAGSPELFVAGNGKGD